MSKKIDSLRVLKLFLDEPERKFNVREVGRLARMNPTTCSRYLSSLWRDGILVRKAERNLLLYAARTESDAYRDFKIYYNIKRIRESRLIEYLEEELGYPEAIILFGSFAKGENTKRSDIDLFILSAAKKELDLSPFGEKLGSPIQAFIHTREEIEEMKRWNKELLNNIINGVLLKGFFEVFK